MIIYGDNKETVGFSEGLKKLESLINSYEDNGFSCHDLASELLITTGEFEAALVDFLCPHNDFVSDMICLIRSLSVASGHIFINSLKGSVTGIKKNVKLFKEKLNKLKIHSISKLLTYSVPEGYAFYALYPEMYLRSADNFYHKFNPSEVTVLGIRSIGTSLSAAVTAYMEEAGCRVQSFTVRPRGFYFERKLITSSHMEQEMKTLHNGYYLIIDEGPGLSGSSFTSVAEKLTSLGLSDERIILFPSHQADGQNFVSEKSKTIWRKHRHFTSEFEDVISIKNLFPEYTGNQEVKDISAGMWRSVIFKDTKDFPPVYTNFEQRKYLVRDKKYLIKFAGLGRYGRDLYERAGVLAKEGFSPEVLGFENGFIISRFIEGRPLSASEVNRNLIEKASTYLSFLRRRFSASCSRTYSEIEEMISVNLMKGLGDEWAEKFNKISGQFKSSFNSSSAAVDGRMLPWEWILFNGTHLKTDSIHHHKDHFFPGSQDITWDTAGFCTEFNLKREEERYFINHYSKQSGDTEIHTRLPFYFIFYLAFRLGFTLFSAHMSTDQTDKNKFHLLASKYAENLKNRLSSKISGTSL